MNQESHDNTTNEMINYMLLLGDCIEEREAYIRELGNKYLQEVKYNKELSQFLREREKLNTFIIQESDNRICEQADVLKALGQEIERLKNELELEKTINNFVNQYMYPKIEATSIEVENWINNIWHNEEVITKKCTQLIIIDGVDDVGKTTIVQNLIKKFEDQELKVINNTFKRRRNDNPKFAKPTMKYEWLFRKEVVQQINRRMTKSFNRGYITPYGNHKMEEEIFRYKNIIDNAIVIFLENKSCWENYYKRETKKGDGGHKLSYETLKKGEYLGMMNINEYNEVYKNINKYPKYQIINERLYRVKNKIPHLVVKEDEYKGVMYLLHDHELSAHFGIRATQEKVKKKYYWKGMDKDIEEYVKSCEKCQRRGKISSKYEMNSIEIKESFYQIGIDFQSRSLINNNFNATATIFDIATTFHIRFYNNPIFRYYIDDNKGYTKTDTSSSKIATDTTKSGKKSQKSRKNKLSASGKQKNNQSGLPKSSAVNNNKSKLRKKLHTKVIKKIVIPQVSVTPI
ncbi:hypothetical protein RclHR1_23720002 [Rhizophagus clarus]|uniref:Integrase zinc-binding domain-containing protein n=1 Tax=Rhizophagus clarus TaxID=94130 RepID=A0A2Z6RR56_9GLOM|nr:hypothetical protein RclHR1_23720002 [Rhizophagus clarus]